MSEVFVAACKLEGKVIRLVYIGEHDVEAAKSRFFATQPRLKGRLDEDLSIEFIEMPSAMAPMLNLRQGETQEWWLG